MQEEKMEMQEVPVELDVDSRLAAFVKGPVREEVTEPPPPAPNLADNLDRESHLDLSFETSTILVHDQDKDISYQQYKIINGLVGTAVRRFTPHAEDLFKSGRWKTLELVEEIAGRTHCRYSGIILLENPQRFEHLGDRKQAWPTLFKIVDEQQKIWMAQAVPDNFMDFTGNAQEVMAARGFPDDKLGAALQAIVALFLEYLRRTTAIPSLTLFRPSYFRPQGQDKSPKQGQGSIIGEIFGTTYLLLEETRAAFNHDLRLTNLGGKLAFQRVLGWTLQIATQLAILRAAHPGAVMKDYHISRVQGFCTGISIHTLFPMLRAQPENELGMVMGAYIEPKARTIQVGTTTIEEDHLILIYPATANRPLIVGTPATRALCHGDQGSYFSVDGAGTLVPGWPRMLQYYAWLVKQPSVIQNKSQNEAEKAATDREGYTLVKGGAPKRDQRSYKEAVTSGGGVSEDRVQAQLNTLMTRFTETERKAALALTQNETTMIALTMEQDARLRAEIRVEELESTMLQMAEVAAEEKTAVAADRVTTKNRFESLDQAVEAGIITTENLWQRMLHLKQAMDSQASWAPRQSEAGPMQNFGLAHSFPPVSGVPISLWFEGLGQDEGGGSPEEDGGQGDHPYSSV